ncbi:MAG: 3-hydroxyacyl-CoA dehydrogenase NAD-binding domain-containing protein, partial [Phycisphaerae bacterium]|nr:3-hydroxyacyl-CoA dehydrogenase NAD-binding domain-containing protein [Phycisphaerae bacterium]
MAKTLRVETDDQNVMTVWLDHADRSVNTFTPQVLDELAEVVGRIPAKDGAPVGVIFASAKANVFVAGADLFEMRGMNAEQTLAFLEQGQKVFDQIANLSMPTVAAINGQCLGGGCELALACDYRVAADSGSITIGLPETKLGILPAWGGTTRLPRLVGLTRALPVLLAGKTMPPRKARSLGLVDDVVRPEALLAAARRFVLKKPAKKRPGRIDRLINAISPLTNFVANKARQQTQAKTFGNYPAADRVIDVAMTGLRNGHAAGLKAEREAAAELAGGDVARNLMRLFFLRQGAKQQMRAQLGEAAAEVNEAAVIGGGVMGAGIVHALLGAGLNVRLVDISPEAVGAALARVRKMLEADVRSKRLSRLEADRAFCRVVPATNYTGLKLADVVIEAVSERPGIKAKVFDTLDERTRADAVLASNTSSLDIGELAAGTKHPHRVIGLHFFNPVPRMPLVEIVPTVHSDK